MDEKINRLSDLALLKVRTDAMITECDRIIDVNKEHIERINKILNGTPFNKAY